VARTPEFRELAHEIALQIAAMAPRYVSEEDVPEEVLAKEREIARERARAQGKPEHVLDRIVAVVDDDVITATELEQRLRLLERQLLRQRAAPPPRRARARAHFL